jgi:hypothetical protein
MCRLLPNPYVMQAVPTNATGKMCMKLSRGISWAPGLRTDVYARLARWFQNGGSWSGTSIFGRRVVKALSTGPAAVMRGREVHSCIGGAGEVSRSDNGR